MNHVLIYHVCIFLDEVSVSLWPISKSNFFLVITLKEFFLILGYINQKAYQNISFSSIFSLFVTCFLIFLALCFSENLKFLMNKNQHGTSVLS